MRQWKGQPLEGGKLQQSLPRGGLAALGLHKHHPFYLAWVNMKTRCDNPKSAQWFWYGARGIRYADSWKRFAQFYCDMFSSWAPGLSLDRIDPDGNYEKGNVEWIPLKNQWHHRRERTDAVQPA